MSFSAFATGVGVGGSIGSTIFSSGAARAARASVDAIRIATQVSRELHDHWRAYYAGCDAATIAAVCAIPIYVAPAATIAGRARLEVIRTLGRKRQQLYRGQSVYNVGKMAQDCNVLAGIEASAAVDASEWGYRRAQNLEIQRNQRRLENIYGFQALGRNLLSNSLGAAALSGSVGAQLGAQQGGALAGWSQLLGFLASPEGQSAVGRFRDLVDPQNAELRAVEQMGYREGPPGPGTSAADDAARGASWPNQPIAFGNALPDVGAQAPIII